MLRRARRDATARRAAKVRRLTKANCPRLPSTLEAIMSCHIHDVAPGFVEGMMPIADVPPGFEAIAARRRAEELAKNGNPKKAKKVDYIEEFDWVREVRVSPNDVQ